MKDREKWMELCALAAKEQDPQKLMELTRQIIRLLDENRRSVSLATGPVRALCLCHVGA